MKERVEVGGNVMVGKRMVEVPERRGSLKGKGSESNEQEKKIGVGREAERI